MALCPNPSGGFAALPREIRNMICEQIASAAGIHVHLYHSNGIYLADEGYVMCIEMLHEWAPRSSMAKAVYEEILSATPFTRQWILASEPVIDLTIPLILGGYIGGMDVTSGTLIDIRDCVRDLELDIRYYHAMMRTRQTKRTCQSLNEE